ncbi:MAG: hypothetical protein Q9216_002530 [Gyalolechia sp. 2 TL-2023]
MGNIDGIEVDDHVDPYAESARDWLSQAFVPANVTGHCTGRSHINLDCDEEYLMTYETKEHPAAGGRKVAMAPTPHLLVFSDSKRTRVITNFSA